MERVARAIFTSGLAPVGAIGNGTEADLVESWKHNLERLNWPRGPVGISAADLADLEAPATQEAIAQLLELARLVSRDEIWITDLHYLSQDRSRPSPERMRQLQDLVTREARSQSIHPPHFVLEERDAGTVLRIFPFKH